MALIADVKMAWAVGLFEGEGSITFSGKQAHLTMQITDKDVLQQFHKIVGKGNFRGPYNYNAKHGYKQVWAWACTKSSDVLELLTLWLPILGRRRKQVAKKAIKMARISSKYRSKFYLKCKAGHKRTRENTSYDKSGSKRCLVCHAIREHKRRQDKKGR